MYLRILSPIDASLIREKRFGKLRTLSRDNERSWQGHYCQQWPMENNRIGSFAAAAVATPTHRFCICGV